MVYIKAIFVILFQFAVFKFIFGMDDVTYIMFIFYTVINLLIPVAIVDFDYLFFKKERYKIDEIFKEDQATGYIYLTFIWPWFFLDCVFLAIYKISQSPFRVLKILNKKD